MNLVKIRPCTYGNLNALYPEMIINLDYLTYISKNFVDDPSGNTYRLHLLGEEGEYVVNKTYAQVIFKALGMSI